MLQLYPMPKVPSYFPLTLTLSGFLLIATPTFAINFCQVIPGPKRHLWVLGLNQVHALKFLLRYPPFLEGLGGSHPQAHEAFPSKGRDKLGLS